MAPINTGDNGRDKRVTSSPVIHEDVRGPDVGGGYSEVFHVAVF